MNFRLLMDMFEVLNCLIECFVRNEKSETILILPKTKMFVSRQKEEAINSSTDNA